MAKHVKRPVPAKEQLRSVVFDAKVAAMRLVEYVERLDEKEAASLLGALKNNGTIIPRGDELAFAFVGAVLHRVVPEMVRIRDVANRAPEPLPAKDDDTPAPPASGVAPRRETIVTLGAEVMRRTG